MSLNLPVLALSLFQLALIQSVLVQSVWAAEAPVNVCEPLLPPALTNKLASDLPGYALPSSVDVGGARNKALSASGDWPCPLVVLGDFDGNGYLDRALLVKARQGDEMRLIGAMNTDGQWQITLSEDWPLALADSELRPQDPGFYQRQDAISKPVEQFDQLASLQVEEAAFSAGKVAGQYALYAIINGKWQKLTLRDQ